MNATNAMKSMKTVFGCCALTLLLGVRAEAASVTTEGATLVIDVPADETYAYSAELPAGVEVIRKTGLGTCDFGVTPYRAFTGTIRVEAGVLSGDSGVGTNGAFGTPAEIHVAKGARFKVVNTWKVSANAAFEGRATSDATDVAQPHTPLWRTHLYVSGDGPDGQGAFWHKAMLSSHNLFGDVTLEADTTLYTESRWGIGGNGVFDMGGHTLTLKGESTSQFELGRPVARVRNPGDIRLEGGIVLFEQGGRRNAHFSNTPGLVLEDMTVGVLSNRTLFAASGTGINVYNGGCPLNIHGIGTSGVVSLNIGHNAGAGEAGYLYGDLTADPGIEMRLSCGQSNAYGGEIQGRIEGETLNMAGTGGSDFRVVLGGTQKGAALTNLWVKKNSLRLVDAGVVAVAGVAKPETWADNVPAPTSIPVQVGLGSGNSNPAYFSVEGQTTLTAAMEAPVTSLSPLYVRMLGNGSWDFSIFEVKDGGAAYADFFIGEKVTQGGAVYLSGETSRLVSRGTGYSRNWFGRTTGYATLDMRGGTHESGGFTCFGENGRGFFMQRGGTVRYGSSVIYASQSNNPLRLARRLGGVAHYVGLGGTFGAGADGGLANVDLGYCDVFVQSDGYTAAFTVGGTCTATVQQVCAWMVTNAVTLKATTALVNLNGRGLLACSELRRKCSNYADEKVQALQDGGALGKADFYVNFDGGTLRATADAPAFFGRSPLFAPDRVTVFAGGARLDTDGHDVTIGSAFEKPYGKGIASVAFTDKENITPVGTRRFRIHGTGVAASVLTDFDAATRTDGPNALVLSSGFGYGADVAVQLERVRDYGTLATTAGNLTADVSLVDYDAPDYVDGGLTKLGAGTLTLASSNTYAGVTRVEAGTLAFTRADGFPGGDLEFPAAALLSGASPQVVAPSLDFAAGKKIRIVGAEILLTADPVRVRPLVTVTTPFAAMPAVEFVGSDGKPVELPAAWSVRLTRGGRVLSFGYRKGLVFLVR